jgi:hypothetical protein
VFRCFKPMCKTKKSDGGKGNEAKQLHRVRGSPLRQTERRGETSSTGSLLKLSVLPTRCWVVPGRKGTGTKLGGESSGREIEKMKRSSEEREGPSAVMESTERAWVVRAPRDVTRNGANEGT